MRRTLLTCLALLAPLPATAGPVSQDASEAPPPAATAEPQPWPDSPWSAPSEILTAPLTDADLRAMVEMDGDPESLSAGEAEMLAVLRQVLQGSPLGNDEP
ncbi:hypothetical protein [Roseisalinus antarcticus]|uniref:Uncharacterized protein n=1 Tax=Roseisalinus antarcticus TaxID=254357 RepID=A0A1Y5TWD7_9RHOB|nr:hypothetical protein [Roseisalinus antarcticus]SLN71514.1 hypothetical protein ROA7023_03514 [Roseisalinus antarcticus]